MYKELTADGQRWYLYGVGSWFEIHPHVVNRQFIRARRGVWYRFGWPFTDRWHVPYHPKVSGGGSAEARRAAP